MNMGKKKIIGKKSLFNEIQEELKRIDINKHIKNHNIDYALSCLDELELKYPNSPFIKFERAIVYLKDINLRDEGFRLLEELVYENKSNAETAKYEIVKNAIYNQKKDLAEKYLFSHDFNTKSDAKRFFLLGLYHYYLKKDFVKARTEFEKAYNFGFNKAKKFLSNIEMKYCYNLPDDQLLCNIYLNNNYLDSKKLEILSCGYNRDYKGSKNKLDQFKDIIYKNMNSSNLKFLIIGYFEINDLDSIKELLNDFSYLLEKDELLYDEARIDLVEGNIDKSLDKLLKICKNKNSKVYFSSKILMADIYNNYNDIRKEKEIYKEIISDDNNEYINLAKLNLLQIYIREKKYDIAVELYNSIDSYYKGTERAVCDRIKTIFNKNGYDYNLVNGTQYSVRMINKYNKSDVILHINKHSYDEGNEVCFNKNININNLYDECNILIKNKKPVLTVGLTDKYIIKYPKVGMNLENEKEFDYIEVVTIYDSKNIITMYPKYDLNPFNRFNYDLNDRKKDNEVIEDNKNSKVKRLSQIEKFNKKYNK